MFFLSTFARSAPTAVGIFRPLLHDARITLPNDTAPDELYRTNFPTQSVVPITPEAVI